MNYVLTTLQRWVSVFNQGGRGEAIMFDIEKSSANPGGYKDHRVVKKKETQGRTKEYFEYISQLKTVPNPTEVQKLVNKGIEKAYQAGVNETPKKKK